MNMTVWPAKSKLLSYPLYKKFPNPWAPQSVMHCWWNESFQRAIGNYLVKLNVCTLCNAGYILSQNYRRVHVYLLHCCLWRQRVEGGWNIHYWGI